MLATKTALPVLETPTEPKPQPDTTVKENRIMTSQKHSTVGVRNWMFRNADQYETATELAEAAACQFDLYENTRDYSIPEWVFEKAAFVKPTE